MDWVVCAGAWCVCKLRLLTRQCPGACRLWAENDDSLTVSAVFLCFPQVSLIDKLLTAFIQPLQQDNISTTHLRAEYEQASSSAASTSSSNSSNSGLLLPANTKNSSSSSGVLPPDWPEHIYRVHCSLNLNTETGRLSARRPNLQNQPALEKDRYKVRDTTASSNTPRGVSPSIIQWPPGRPCPSSST
jgi:hypothetical protein